MGNGGVERKRALYLALVEYMGEDIEDFRVDFKDTTSDWKLKLVSKVVGVFNKDFEDEYTTTLYPVVYFPNKSEVLKNPDSSFNVLAHEYIHLFDEEANRFWFPVSYLMPQILSVFSLLAFGAFWNPWFLLCLLFLLFLAPIPSPWRTHWELRGYAANLAIEAWEDGQVSQETKDWMAKKFTGWAYYRMWPFKKSIERKIQNLTDKAESGDLLKEDGSYPYKMIRVIWLTA